MDNDTRWGIIYCPKQGIAHTQRRWEHIQTLLRERGVSYDFVQSDGEGSVARLATMLTMNGYRTLIVVGGDAALGQALNGIMAAGDDIYKEMTLGVIPNGRFNDYARFWGFDEDRDEQTIDHFLARRIRRVDVGLLKQGERRIYFLDSVNVGLVAHIMNLRYRSFRFWGMSTLSYATSFIALLFHRMETHMRLKVNYETLDRSIMTVAIGCARNYGLTPNAVPYNGMLDVSIVSQPEALKLVSGMWMLLSGRFLGNKSVRAYRTRTPIHVFARGKARLAVDGTVYKLSDEPFEVTVRQECLNFIIPSL